MAGVYVPVEYSHVRVRPKVSSIFARHIVFEHRSRFQEYTNCFRVPVRDGHGQSGSPGDSTGEIKEHVVQQQDKTE